MDTARIAELLLPFAGPGTLSPLLLEKLRCYLELLVRWNSRINLTAVREREEIVARHFGESMFAARVLLGAPARPGTTLADLGSGAGFPGVPIKLYAPDLSVTLIESQNKKAVFLREVVRTLSLQGVEVFCGRAEQWSGTADIVTLRAVERFELVLPVAAGLVTPGGKLGLLIGAAQTTTAREMLGARWSWNTVESIPCSDARTVAVAKRH